MFLFLLQCTQFSLFSAFLPVLRIIDINMLRLGTLGTINGRYTYIAIGSVCAPNVAKRDWVSGNEILNICPSQHWRQEVTVLTQRPKKSHPCFDNDPQCWVKKTQEGALEKHLWDLPHSSEHHHPCERTNIIICLWAPMSKREGKISYVYLVKSKWKREALTVLKVS